MGNISAKFFGHSIPLNQTPGRINIKTLPKEILLRFTDHLTPSQLHTLQSTSKTNEAFFGSNYIWKTKFQKHFSNDVFIEVEKQFHDLGAEPDQQHQFWQTAFRVQDEKEYGSLSADAREFLFTIKEQDVQSLDILLNRLRRKVYLTDFLSRTFKKVTYLELMQQSNHQPLLDLIYSYTKSGYPMHWAIQCRQSVMELRRLSKYAHSKNKASLTGLYLAALEGNAQAIRFLCEEQHIDPNAIDNQSPDGSMPLYVAAQQGHTDAVNVLVEARATIDVIFRGEYTPLFIACQNGHTHIVQLLLQNQANINAIARGTAPFYIAAQQGHAVIVKILLEAGSAIETTYKGFTALYIACTHGHEAVVQLLLQNEANPNAIGGDGSTPLYVAAQNGHTKIVPLLLRYNANIEQGWNRFTPLSAAIQNGHREIVQLLLQNQANLHGDNGEGQSYLYIAAKGGYTAIVALLLDYGANIEDAALFVAAQNGHLKTVQLLVQKGVNPNAINEDGLTPLYLAAQNGRMEIVRLLLTIGAAVGNADINNLNTPSLKILLTLKAYIEKTASVPAQPPVGFFAQHSVSQNPISLITVKDLLTTLLNFDNDLLIVTNFYEILEEYQLIDQDLVRQLELCMPGRTFCAIM